MSYFSRWNKDGFTDSQILNHTNQAINNANPMDLMFEEIMQDMGYSKDEAIAHSMGNVDTAIQLTNEAQDRTIAQTYAAARLDASKRLAAKGVVVAPQSYWQAWNAAINIVRDTNSLDPNDPVPFAQVEEEFNALLNAAVEARFKNTE
jgi:thioesterase domain-containing protein